MTRLKNVTARGGDVTITVDGVPVPAYEHETVGMAILASGRRILGRSLKYHRPRSMFCSTGSCQRCLMEIDGIPNRRACSTPVRDGMQVRSQNAFPSVENDWLSLMDRFSDRLQTSFYHHRFLKPKFLRQTYLRLLKRFTGLGRLHIPPAGPVAPRHSPALPDLGERAAVVVVGAGPAGLSAAISAADAGAPVLLLDEESHSLTPATDPGPHDLDDYGALRAELAATAAAHPGITLWSGAVLSGIYEGTRLGVARPDDLLVEIEPSRLVLATGAYDTLPVFENNDLPGVFSARLVEKMVLHYGLRPGSRALVWGGGPAAERVLDALKTAGTAIAGIVTAKPASSDGVRSRAKQLGVPVYEKSVVTATRGRGHVKTAEIQHLENGRPTRAACDLLVVCHLQPRYELQYHAGCRMTFDEQRGGLAAQVNDRLQSSQGWIYLAGEALGVEKSPGLCRAEGALAGMAAAADLGYGDTPLTALQRSIQSFGAPPAAEPGPLRAEASKGHVCCCQDVRLHEIEQEREALHTEALDTFESELLKRRTGALTGPCQGKMCLGNFLKTLTPSEDPLSLARQVPTVRPPITPLSISRVAASEFIRESSESEKDQRGE